VPGYGFRLDELYEATNEHDVFTFDFDHAASNMTMASSAAEAAGPQFTPAEGSIQG
jgi:hypothetical protein